MESRTDTAHPSSATYRHTKSLNERRLRLIVYASSRVVGQSVSLQLVESMPLIEGNQVTNSVELACTLTDDSFIVLIIAEGVVSSEAAAVARVLALYADSARVILVGGKSDVFKAAGLNKVAVLGNDASIVDAARAILDLIGNTDRASTLRGNGAALGSQSISADNHGTTRREREVLSLLASGYSIRQIAQLLDRSESTIANHKQRLMRRLGIHSATGLVIFAFRNGYVPADSAEEQHPLPPRSRAAARHEE